VTRGHCLEDALGGQSKYNATVKDRKGTRWTWECWNVMNFHMMRIEFLIGINVTSSQIYGYLRRWPIHQTLKSCTRSEEEYPVVGVRQQ
jgi:hypothetical protein